MCSGRKENRFGKVIALCLLQHITEDRALMSMIKFKYYHISNFMHYEYFYHETLTQNMACQPQAVIDIVIITCPYVKWLVISKRYYKSRNWPVLPVASFKLLYNGAVFLSFARKFSYKQAVQQSREYTLENEKRLVDSQGIPFVVLVIGDQADRGSVIFNMWLFRLPEALTTSQKMKVAGDFYGLGLKVVNGIFIYIGQNSVM